MLNLNPTTLAAVVEQATHDAANHPRWLQAIARAIVELESNPWIARGELHGLVIGSPSGNVYSANGTCQCPAHTYGNACWHRAAARLVRLHDEREAAQRQIVCQQPDNLCELHNPCAEHAPAAAAYLPQEAKLNRKIAAARATAQMNELFA